MTAKFERAMIEEARASRLTAEEPWTVERLRKHIESRLDMAHGQMSMKAYEEAGPSPFPDEEADPIVFPPHVTGRIIHRAYAVVFMGDSALPNACRFLAENVDDRIERLGLEGRFAIWRKLPSESAVNGDGTWPSGMKCKLTFRLGIDGDTE
jgi:hypothetical protein